MHKSSKKQGSSSGRDSEWKPLALTTHNLNSLLRNLGISKLRVERIFDHPCVSNLEVGLRALVLFYKWRPHFADKNNWNPSQSPNLDVQDSGFVDSSEQCVSNSLLVCNHVSTGCAVSQALVGVALNLAQAKESPLKLNQELVALQRFLIPLEPALRSAVINDSTFIRGSHNKTVANGESEPGSTEEFWHYISFAPSPNGNQVVSIESLGGQVNTLGQPETDEHWASLTEAAIDAKIDLFRSSGVRFKMFGVYTDSKSARKRRDTETGSEDSREPDRKKRRKLDGTEFVIRKHDYTPFLIEMTKILSSEGVLKRLMTRALKSEHEEGSYGVPSENEQNGTGDDDHVSPTDDVHSDGQSNDDSSDSGGNEDAGMSGGSQIAENGRRQGSPGEVRNDVPESDDAGESESDGDVSSPSEG